MQAHASSSSLATELFLRYPEELGFHASVTYEQAVSMLIRAVNFAATVPFLWGYIDKPQDGSLYMVFLLPHQQQFPNDGVRYQDQENRQVIPAGSGRELEICEIKFGFIPNSTDTAAYRVRRRFRLVKGGHPQLILIHYSRGQSMSIMPNLMMQPVRAYPLRQINEPRMFVLGEKAGQKIYPQQQPQPHAASHAPGMPGLGQVPAGMQHQAALLAAKNRDMESLERRQARERGANMAGHIQASEDDSGDEYDHISTRSLALARYKRNHDFMNEVFIHAAFGERIPKEIPKTYACFDEAELKDKTARLQKEIEELRSKAASRKEEVRRQGDLAQPTTTLDAGDVSMEGLGPAPVEASA